MTQYDAGPGDRSDRPWEAPERKPKPQARRRSLTLPPWALLAILVGIIVLLCVGLVLAVQAIRGQRDEGLPTVVPSITLPPLATSAPPAATATKGAPPTETVVLPISSPQATAAPTELGPGALVVVEGTTGSGLNLRSEATTQAGVTVNVRDGTVLTVVDGPQEKDGYVWWKLRTADGQEGWGAANWLALKTE